MKQSALSVEEHLRHTLAKLRDEHGLVALKSGTEVEDMEDRELTILRRISLESSGRGYRSVPRLLPFIVKIGGPEARRDMRMCLGLGVDCILAPMVESTYSLDNFVETARSLCQEVLGRDPKYPGKTPASTHYSPQLAVNIETSTACSHFDDMLFSQAATWLSQITIGRGDLSKSMHLSVDAQEVSRHTALILAKATAKGLRTSVGGGLSLGNIASMAETFATERFNTRHMVFANNGAFKSNPQAHLIAGLRFEQELYGYLAATLPTKRKAYEERVRVLEARLGGHGTV